MTIATGLLEFKHKKVWKYKKIKSKKLHFFYFTRMIRPNPQIKPTNKPIKHHCNQPTNQQTNQQASKQTTVCICMINNLLWVRSCSPLKALCHSRASQSSFVSNINTLHTGCVERSFRGIISAQFFSHHTISSHEWSTFAAKKTLCNVLWAKQNRICTRMENQSRLRCNCVLPSAYFWVKEGLFSVYLYIQPCRTQPTAGLQSSLSGLSLVRG